MQLEIADPATFALVKRLQKEMGELMVANCWLDEHCNAFKDSLKEKDNQILILQDKIKAYDDRIQELLNQQNTKDPDS